MYQYAYFYIKTHILVSAEQVSIVDEVALIPLIYDDDTPTDTDTMTRAPTE